MTRRRKDPLRRTHRHQHATNSTGCAGPQRPLPPRSPAPAALLLVGALGIQEAARAVGRKSGDAVSHLVARFNQEGLTALEPRHGGGRAAAYDAADRDRILREVVRTPTPGAGTGRRLGPSRPCGRVLRSAPTACRVSTFTLLASTAPEAGYCHRGADPRLVPDRGGGSAAARPGRSRSRTRTPSPKT